MFDTILISGDRNWTDRAFFDRAMAKWVAKHGMPKRVIEGCARGADSMAEDWANAHGIDIEGYGSTPGEHGPFPAVVHTISHFPAQWRQHDSYGQICWCKDKTTDRCRGAGPIRNQRMLDEGPDAVIAFHTNLAESHGTLDMVTRARKAGVPVWVPYPQPQLTMDSGSNDNPAF